MILCDTNILMELYRHNPEIVQVVKSIGQHNIAVSDVTSAELGASQYLFTAKSYSLFFGFSLCSLWLNSEIHPPAIDDYADDVDTMKFLTNL